jgi:hypothetical protein
MADLPRTVSIGLIVKVKNHAGRQYIPGGHLHHLFNLENGHGKTEQFLRLRPISHQKELAISRMQHQNARPLLPILYQLDR